MPRVVQVSVGSRSVKPERGKGGVKPPHSKIIDASQPAFAWKVMSESLREALWSAAAMLPLSLAKLFREFWDASIGAVPLFQTQRYQGRAATAPQPHEIFEKNLD